MMALDLTVSEKENGNYIRVWVRLTSGDYAGGGCGSTLRQNEPHVGASISVEYDLNAEIRRRCSLTWHTCRRYCKELYDQPDTPFSLKVGMLQETSTLPQAAGYVAAVTLPRGTESWLKPDVMEVLSADL